MAVDPTIGNGDANEQLRRLQRWQSSKLLPVGFAFRPTDLELIAYHLRRKNAGSLQNIYQILVPEVDVFTLDPWDLPDKSSFQSGDPVWHFFSRKNRSGQCHNTAHGRWAITPKERDIVVPSRSLVIGKKRTLIFYQNPHSKRKVSDIWAIHEYHTMNDQDDFVLCRLLKKPVEMFQKDSYRHKNMASSHGIPPQCDAIRENLGTCSLAHNHVHWSGGSGATCLSLSRTSRRGCAQETRDTFVMH